MNEIQHPLIVKDISDVTPSLARDLAMDLYTHEEIIDRHGLDAKTIRRLLKSKTFKAMVAAAKQEWESPGNAKTRAQLKAQLAVEEAIPDIYSIISDEKAPDPARVAAFAQLKEVGKFERQPADAGSGGGPGFSVIINLGEKTVDIAGSIPRSNVEDAETVE
jgi:hypothetical protein